MNLALGQQRTQLSIGLGTVDELPASKVTISAGVSGSSWLLACLALRAAMLARERR